ncbi:MAG: sigma-54-dependent Fis family transcriptional regulator [Myxococcales bacterium]|nr:sigma-54-dependent Fis family transcriptional regulator [Myxococcales bacterium]
MDPDHLQRLRRELDDEERPSIVISPDYEVLSSNAAYRRAFGDGVVGRRCYAVSHGYDAPCDQRGELCPLAQARSTDQPARVLHVHRTPRGPEHVDVSLRPVHDDDGALVGFVEHLRSIRQASATPQAGAQLGISRAFNAALELALRAAPTEVPVLVLGESGTGKERLAQAIHAASARSEGPFVAVACSGLSESLFESELFGHERGAFTGAHARKRGLVETAEGGTLFLDEVGDIPVSLQVKLLRVLESGTFRRVGGTQPIQANFRLVSATWRDLDQRVAEERFRPDLFYRISAFPIEVPALRDRIEDLGLLVPAILDELGAEQVPSAEAMEVLRRHSWPGNVRELRNALHRGVILADGERLEPHHLALRGSAEPPTEGPPSPTRIVPLAEMERRYLTWCATQVDSRADLARMLGVGERTLYRKLARLRGQTD